MKNSKPPSRKKFSKAGRAASGPQGREDGFAHPHKSPKVRRRDDSENTGTLPTREELKEFLLSHPDALNKRDIARAFGITGQDRTQLRRLLREMTEEGMLEKNENRSYQAPDSLPERAFIEIIGISDDGELLARPLEWHGRGKPPAIYVIPDRKRGAALKDGERMLARLRKVSPHEYEARVLKPLEERNDLRIVGFYKSYRGGGVVTPTDKKNKLEYMIPPEFANDAQDGDLVSAELLPPSRQYPRNKNAARVAEVIGQKDDPKLISLIAIHTQGIPVEFPRDVLAESEELSEPDLSGGRVDMRDIPLVTIDGVDARDFDDAVYAVPDEDPKNPGGWKLIVAIADVSYYVRAGKPLDVEALKRGNSTYFADRVVPMLPERLSNDLCSLRPHVPRACLAAFMTIDKNARLVDYYFQRGLMRSAARLTYEQVEDAHRGNPDDTTGPLMDVVIRPLYKAYSLLKHARQKRGALEIDLPERKAIINDKGQITAIVPRARLDSHQLIEEFMILANVAAARQLEDKNAPCVYRIHDQPSAERIEAARELLKDMGYSLPETDNIHPRNINQLLKTSSERGDADLVHTLLLRTQSQAIYHPDNIGHFGLALEKYAHFTSPIRRYADLVVHRSLVRACKLGDGGLTPHEEENIFDISEHISQTERRSMLAERDVMDRFTAQYLQSHIGQVFKGKISSVASFGLFVTLDESGADGILPMRQLPRDYYIHDEKRHMLVGKETRRTFRMADAVYVRLLEANPQRGSTVFELVEGADDGEGFSPRPPRQDRGHHRGARGQGQKDRRDGARRNDSGDRQGRDGERPQGGRGGKNKPFGKKNKKRRR
ncbi:MAG TPA: ribonuclease R [Alphaproteobacteria bacterium]|mgnify:CR=1 FL=1|nr:ribonuclease R [Alphaproteobacteria bacterium]